MKLNLGCGPDVRAGYVNVDFRQTHPDVVGVDLSRFPWPWGDGSVDEIMMLDFLEHFPISMADTILIECHRVLKKGGSLIVQVPDMEMLGMALARVPGTLCNSCGTVMHPSSFVCSRCGQLWGAIQEAAIGRIYGGQDYEGNFHQNGFTYDLLSDKLFRTGFVGTMRMESEHQRANWNFKVLARKF